MLSGGRIRTDEVDADAFGVIDGVPCGIDNSPRCFPVRGPAGEKMFGAYDFQGSEKMTDPSRFHDRIGDHSRHGVRYDAAGRIRTSAFGPDGEFAQFTAYTLH